MLALSSLCSTLCRSLGPNDAILFTVVGHDYRLKRTSLTMLRSLSQSKIEISKFLFGSQWVFIRTTNEREVISLFSLVIYGFSNKNLDFTRIPAQNTVCVSGSIKCHSLRP